MPSTTTLSALALSSCALSDGLVFPPFPSSNALQFVVNMDEMAKRFKMDLIEW